MKLLILALALVGSFASEAQDSMPQIPEKSADLVVHTLDPNHFVGMDITGASITVPQAIIKDRLQRIHLKVTGGRMTEDIVARVVDVENGPCGRSITARRDTRPVNSTIETLMVSEYSPTSDRHCGRPLHPTYVSYTTNVYDQMNRVVETYTSTFGGPALKIR